MNLNLRHLFLIMLMPPSWLFPSFIGHNSIIIASATLCGPLPSTCLPTPPCPPPLIPPPLPPAPPPPLPQLPCPMPCPSPHPPAPPPPLPQLPCPTPCPPPLPSLPPAPPPPPLLQLPCPSPCPPPTPPSPCPLPPPRLPTPNCPSPPTTYQPFLPQPAQTQYQTYLPSPQVPYAPNQQQIVPPSYSTRPIPIPLAPQPVPQSNTYQLPQPSPYATQPGLSYGYANPYQNPIPAKERSVHNPEEKEEQTTHERVKDPFEKIEDNEAENKSGGDERTKTTGKQRTNPQFQRDDNYIVPGYARPTTPIDVPLPKPMSPIIYPTPLPVYQQRPPPLQQMLPATIYQPSPQPISQQWPYPQQLQCPPFPLPSPQPLPPPPQPAPIQNCCLRCPYTKTTALLKSYGVKTITKPYLHSGISSSVDELAFHTKKRDEGKCNDKELAAILGEVSTMKMNLAKETILERVEKRMLTSTSGHQRPNILFHVVCAPRMLEYIVRSEKFCAGDVADGICFVFRTGQ
uniref:Ground-like domain-containing protein n=1 Tax=Meloidogyne javanica TaxID=6303 RepID=A0A915MJE9_MELJA